MLTTCTKTYPRAHLVFIDQLTGQGGQSVLLAAANLATSLTSAIYTEGLTFHGTSSRFDILHRKRPGPAALPRGFPWPRRPQGLPPVHMGRGRLPPPVGPGGEPISALLGSRGFSDSPPQLPMAPFIVRQGLTVTTSAHSDRPGSVK